MPITWEVEEWKKSRFLPLILQLTAEWNFSVTRVVLHSKPGLTTWLSFRGLRIFWFDYGCVEFDHCCLLNVFCTDFWTAQFCRVGRVIIAMRDGPGAMLVYFKCHSRIDAILRDGVQFGHSFEEFRRILMFVGVGGAWRQAIDCARLWLFLRVNRCK